MKSTEIYFLGNNQELKNMIKGIDMIKKDYERDDIKLTSFEANGLNHITITCIIENRYDTFTRNKNNFIILLGNYQMLAYLEKEM